MLAQQVSLVITQQLGDAVVDETELTLEIEDINQVGGIVDHVAMQLLGMCQPALNLCFFFLDTRLVQRVMDRVLEFIVTVGLAENIVSAETHRLGDLVDRGFATEDDNAGFDVAIANEGQYLVA